MNGKIRDIFLVRVNAEAVVRSRHPHGAMPPFSLKYIQGLLAREQRITTHLLDCAAENILLPELARMTVIRSPDIIVISATCLDSAAVRRYAALIKEAYDPVVIVIGQYTQRGHDGEDPVDIFVPGEGEIETARLIRKLREGAPVAGLRAQYKPEGSYCLVEDPDSLPFPPFAGRELRRYGPIFPLPLRRKAVYGFVLSSRGCAHGCAFCSQAIRVSFGRKVRLRSAVRVVDEIEHLRGRGANVISFADDNFTAVRQHVASVCGEMVRRGLRIPWIAHARVDDELDSPLLALMKRSGCVLLRFGIESGSPRIVQALKKTLAPGQWNARARETFGLLKAHGIAAHALFIIGSPGETEHDVEESMRLARAIRPDMIQIHFFTPYPDTALPTEEAVKRCVVPRFLPELYHYARPTLQWSAVSPVRLERLRTIFYRRFFFRFDFMIRHLKDHVLFYMFNGDLLLRLFAQAGPVFRKGTSVSDI